MRVKASSEQTSKRSFGQQHVALTLIEVIVAMVLAGTLLAIALRATTSHLAQAKRATKKANALIVLDQFLSDWSLREFTESSFQESAHRCGLHLDISLGSDSRAKLHPGAVVVTHQVRRAESLASAEIVRVEIQEGTSKRLLAWAEIIRRSSVP